MSNLENRYDFILLFDVINGNPNGDPDAGNLPRMDPETGLGLVSDVSLKRKVRNYIELAHGDEPGHSIYVKDGSILNEQHRKAYLKIRDGDDSVIKATKLNPKSDDEANKLRAFMCEHFFDVRTFGAVMSTGINCGQVRGPVQMTFAQSMEPIVPSEISITRMAATTEKEKKERVEGSADDERTDNRTMGRKHLVPYALYKAHGFISASLAGQTGFSTDDLDRLFTTLSVMFESDRSAARGLMSTRALIIFKHDNKLGNAPAHALFDRVSISRRGPNGDKVPIGSPEAQQLPPARAYTDYIVEIDRSDAPDSVEIIERV
ncbi:MAG: type I-C CRISPR-associated protein Cas7/Csd2 [Gammaproteobacteria bacterium]|nr:type I-C CRISPR-associated protein Cas7/Csd2 [Gammaproteobacteria bacterium]